VLIFVRGRAHDIGIDILLIKPRKQSNATHERTMEIFFSAKLRLREIIGFVWLGLLNT
jgi:phosphopantetheinyl transferase